MISRAAKALVTAAAAALILPGCGVAVAVRAEKASYGAQAAPESQALPQRTLPTTTWSPVLIDTTTTAPPAAPETIPSGTAPTTTWTAPVLVSPPRMTASGSLDTAALEPEASGARVPVDQLRPPCRALYDLVTAGTQLLTFALDAPAVLVRAAALTMAESIRILVGAASPDLKARATTLAAAGSGLLEGVQRDPRTATLRNSITAAVQANAGVMNELVRSTLEVCPELDAPPEVDASRWLQLG